MSFVEYKELIGDGDLVILQVEFNKLLAVKVKTGTITQTKYGGFKHSEIIGVRYGDKIQCSKGWLRALYPTPELWTLTLPHRTQILYSPDISLIVFSLDLKPGSVVVESGTGSGSLSHALIRSIMPTGHLHTFEFHKERADKARQEFVDHKLGPFVTVTHRDACSNEGFGLSHVADAVFLDLPQPWDAIDSAVKAIKLTGGRICSFSPCIEQVQRTCLKLSECGFEDIDMIECVNRPLDVRTCNLPIADLGYSDSSSESSKRFKKDETQGETSIETSDKTANVNLNMNESVEKSGVQKVEDTPSKSDIAIKPELHDTSDQRVENISVSGKEDKIVKASGEGSKVDDSFITIKGLEKNAAGSNKLVESKFSYKTVMPSTSTMLGHTGYLTFATLYDQNI